MKGLPLSEQMQHVTANDEINLSDILLLLKRYKWLLIGAPVVAAVVAGAIVMQMPHLWEATALAQIGQIGQVGPIEPTPQAVGRVMNPSFMFTVFARLGVKPDESLPELKLYRETFKAKQLPNTDLLELRLRAPSIDEAKKQITTTVNQLRDVHNAMLEPSINHMRLDLAAVEKGIQDGRNAINELQQRILSSKSGSDSAGTVLYFMLYQQRVTEVRELERKKLSVEEQLNPARTYPTALVGDIYVNNQPVAPKRKLIVSLAALMGLLSGVFVAYMHNLIRKKN